MHVAKQHNWYQTHQHATISLGAAGIDLVGVRGSGAGQDGVGCAGSPRSASTSKELCSNGHTKPAGVVLGGDPGVQPRRCQLGQGGDGDERAFTIHDEMTMSEASRRSIEAQEEAVKGDDLP